MKTSAQPADERASRIFGTVKKRMMMWGSPAVPTMSAAVIATTSRRGFQPEVNAGNPRSTLIRFSTSSSSCPGRAPRSAAPSAVSVPPIPSGGTGLPVSMIETKMAGTRYAAMRTTYCATCV